MSDEIKYSIQACKIDEKREEHKEIEEKLFQIDRKMAEMVFDRVVGLYANKLDRYIYLLQFVNTVEVEKQGKIKKEIADLEKYIIESRSNYNIIRYRALRSKYMELKKMLGNYYQAINIDLRNQLSGNELPDIYIYQEENNVPILNHIIVPNKKISVSSSIEKIVIFPFYEMHSNREFRHFYNKKSFKYLEELSKDYNYKLENKKLGKIKIKKM